MKITLVCDVLGEENHGLAIVAMNLIRYFSIHHDVKILCSDQTKTNLSNYFVLKEKDFGKFINTNLFDKTGYRLPKIDSSIIKQSMIGSDVVYIMVPFSLGIAAAKVANELHIPVIGGFHLLPQNVACLLHLLNLPLLNSFLYLYFWKTLYKRCNVIHYPTKFSQQIFEKHIRKQTNGYVVSNGIREDVIAKKIEKPDKYKDKIVIVCCGRFNREKSQDTLIKAVKKSEFANKIQLIFLGGKGFKLDKYKRLSKKLVNQPIFTHMKHNELINVVNYCDLFVHPADIEIEGMAVLEAMCCGKLVIVSDSKTSATKDFAVDKRCIFKSRNPKSLAKCIDFWIKNPELKKECEAKYLKSPYLIRQNECMKKMEQMLADVVDKYHKTATEKFILKTTSKK